MICFNWIKFIFLSLPLLIIQTSLVISQTEKYQIESFGLEQGLSSNCVLEILQDSRGFLWFGTADGLNRYDGYELKLFSEDPFDSSSISGSYITALIEDASGTLWIGSDGGGLCKYDHIKNTFASFKADHSNPGSISSNKIWAIFEDSKGNLWIGTERGLNLFDRETGEFSHWENKPGDENSLSHNQVLAIQENADGSLWLATRYGLNKFNPERNIFYRYKHKADDPHSLSDDRILALFVDNSGILWIGTVGGGLNRMTLDKNGHPLFARYNLSQKSPVAGLKYIMQSRDGLLWIGSEETGIQIFNPQTEHVEVLQKESETTGGLADNTIYAIAEDKSGIIWAGSLNAGVQKISKIQNPFKVYRYDPANPNSLSGNIVASLLEDESGNIWVGTFKNGLNEFNPQTREFVRYIHDPNNPASLSHNYVKSIYRDGEGILWIGTWTDKNSLNRMVEDENGSAVQFVHYGNNPEIPGGNGGNIVRSIKEDLRGNLWIGTANNGLNRFDRHTETFYAYRHNPADPKSISSDGVMDIYVDNEGILWLATWSGGLNKFNPETNQFTHYTSQPDNPKSISNNRVWSVFEDSEGRLWVCTSGGLNLFDREIEEFDHFTERDGLCSNLVYNVVEDNRKNLWIITSNGLSRFIPETGSFTNFYSSDGLPSNEFNTGGILLSRSGEIYLGTTNGLCCFHPDSMKQNKHVPEIVLTSFKIFEEEAMLDSALSEIKAIELSFKDQFFSFEFAALDFVDPLKNQYAYRLEGLSENWIYCGKRRFVSFSHLDPGKYMFTVKGSNNAGVWNEQGTSVRLIIHPPFWRTWWAYLIYGIVLFGMVLGGRWVVVNWKSIISIRAKKISHYKLLALLGKGGMGEVYKAVDVITKEIVALKVLNDELLTDPENKKRLSNEGRLLTSFTHPNIVKVFEVGETEEQGFIAMEYLCGGTLREYLEKNNPLPIAEIKNFLLQIGEGLGEIHKNGIIHRDIKSGNIMLDESGEIRIMDFGLSKSPLVTTMTTMGTIIGTLGYVAPEQITGMHLDHRVDIFSYGVVVFELLTAQLPFNGENEMALIHSIFNTVPPPPSTLRKSISSEWDTIVSGCLAKNPCDRFQSVESLNNAIQKVDG